MRYCVAGGTFVHRYVPADDHVEVSLACDAEEVEAVSLPGPLIPAAGPREVAAPLYQGLLLSEAGEEWELTVGHGGHLNFSMAMGAVLGERGALLVCHESPSNWSATFGRTEDGPFFRFEHRACPVDGWVGGVVRLYPTDPDLTSACKRYRARLKERGEFVTWQEKIARKPVVQDLFGAMTAFVGYNACPDVDYAAGARELRRLGFESVFYYPVRMCHYSLDFQMGGGAPIWLSDGEVGAIKSVAGARVSPWAWVVEGLDDGSEAMRSICRRSADGGLVPNWRIDDQQWYLVCTPYQVQHIKGRLAGDMRAMDWLHFDVNAVWAGRRCFEADHALHDSRPMGALGDMEWTRRLFSPETVGNRIVSSEGFNDYYAGWYDIGSTKMMPPMPWDPACAPVPMTMLVFHDSCIHDWWELHNYNAHDGFGLSGLPHGIGTTGSGRPELKASMDALYGCPPNLFPFGKQYAWADFAARKSYSYTVRLDDPTVQTALQAALPVARLHKTTGVCELASFEFLSDDRAVQATEFSDGTRIVANLAEHEAEVPDMGALPPHSWRRL
ncbi:MAG: hypothetical protein AMK73_05125 [Planctomycetes bacterium SM23_32]|nr:MAG: hypothetical protein AMK73_05125 [Planctomycetes bacterium SM23_32]